MNMADYKSTAVFRKGLLLQWLKIQTGGSEEKMRRAQWEFTQSCAGYSVAAYILGAFRGKGKEKLPTSNFNAKKNPN